MDRALDVALHHDRFTGRQQASEELRTWLAYGTIAVLLDGVFCGLAAFLELRHWGRPGLTPDVVVGYVAALPQMVVLFTFLRIGREITSRGLWKGAVGVIVSGWVGELLQLADLEVLGQTWAFGISLVAGVGILGLLVLLFSRVPTWASANAGETNALDAGTAKPDSRATDAGSAVSGCLIHLVLAAVFVLLRVLLRNGNQLLPGGDLDLETWTSLEFLALSAVALIYAILFATAKIRRRHDLGSAAAALGVFEIVTIVLHVAMMVALVVMTALAVMANPQLNEEQFTKQLQPMMQGSSIASAVLYGLWTIATAWFFTQVSKRYARDWREDVLGL